MMRVVGHGKSIVMVFSFMRQLTPGRWSVKVECFEFWTLWRARQFYEKWVSVKLSVIAYETS